MNPTTTAPARRSHSDYTDAELASVLTIDLALADLLALHNLAVSGLATEQKRLAKQEARDGTFVPPPGRVNSIVKAIARREALVAVLDAAIDFAEAQFDDIGEPA